MRIITPEEAWAITCHESGHAVVGVQFNLLIDYIERGEGEHGIVEACYGPISQPEDHWESTEIRHWQLFYAAGAAAEELLFGSHRDYGAVLDKRFHKILQDRFQTPGWEKDVQGAKVLLSQESIKRIAVVLDKEKRLSGDRVYWLLGKAPPW
jgi:hypothetical protein